MDNMTHLQSLIEGIPGNVFAVDRNYCYLYFNSNYKNLLRHTHSLEIEPGMYSLDNIETEEEKLKAKAAIDRALSGDTFAVTTSYVTENGTRLTYEINYYPLRNENSVYGVAVAAYNITDRDTADKKETLLEHRLYSFGQSFPEFFIITDPQASIKFSSRSFQVFSERTPSEMNNWKFTDILSEKQQRDFTQKLSEISLVNPFVTVVCQMISPSGIKQWTLWTEMGVYDAHGNLFELISVGKNINNIVESAIEREAYIKTLEDAIFRTSHQVRQPVAQLLGMMNLMNENEPSAEELRKMTEFYRGAAEQLDNYIRELNVTIVDAYNKHKNVSKEDELIAQVERVHRMENENR